MHDTYNNEEQVEYGKEYFLLAYDFNGSKVKGTGILKGKVIEWKTEREASGKRRFISKIDLLSQLKKENKAYIQVEKGLCKKILEDYEDEVDTVVVC